MREIDASMLSKIGELQKRLLGESKRESLEKALAGVQKDSLLETEIDKKKSELGGDLSGLPEGHPLLLEIEEAKKRSQTIVPETKKIDVKIRKPKKVGKDHRKDENDEDKIRIANESSESINRSIERILVEMKELGKLIASTKENFIDDYVSRTRMAKLSRFIQAADRGMLSCRIPKR